MSQFLPENSSGATVPGQTSLTPATQNVTLADVSLMQRVLNAAAQNPNLIPDTFMAYVVDFIQTSRLEIPIGQVFGFVGYTVQASSLVGAFESTSATAYGDLATVGPTLDSLADGNYLVLLVADIDIATAGKEAHMSYDPNGAGASDTWSAQCRSSDFVTCCRPSLVRLASGANTLTAKYRSDTAGAISSTFGNRQLFALKYANL